MSPNLSCRYSARSGFELTGDRTSLTGLSSDIRRCCADGSGTLRLELRAGVAEPYDENVLHLIIVASHGALRITHAEAECRIEAGCDELLALAENIEHLALTDELGDHLHIEYYPEHPYIDASAEPLVVEVVDE